jgi:hypothetical protein
MQRLGGDGDSEGGDDDYNTGAQITKGLSIPFLLCVIASYCTDSIHTVDTKPRHLPIDKKERQGYRFARIEDNAPCLPQAVVQYTCGTQYDVA